MFNKKAFGEAKVGGNYEQFPDGWNGRVAVESIHIKEDGHFGPRFIAEFKSTETGQRGSMSLGLIGKAQSMSYGKMKALYAACLGIEAKDTAKIQEEVTADVHEAATVKNVFRGHLLDIRVSYKANPQNAAKPFVNFVFNRVVDANGDPLTVD